MQPPSIRRLLVEDFPSDQQQWIGTLLQVINQFMDETGAILNKGVSLKDNSYVQVKTLTFKGNTSILGTISIGSNSLTNVSSTYGMINGMSIIGDGIPANTIINSVAGTTITMSNNATKAITGVPLIIGNNFPLNFKYELAGKPLAILIGDIYENVSNPLPIVSANNVNWDFNNNQVTISHISGLRPNIDYSATFLVFGG